MTGLLDLKKDIFFRFYLKIRDNMEKDQEPKKQDPNKNQNNNPVKNPKWTPVF